MPRTKASAKKVTTEDAKSQAAAVAKGRKTNNSAAAAAAESAAAGGGAVEVPKAKRKAQPVAAAAAAAAPAESEEPVQKKPKKLTKKQLAAQAASDAELAMLNSATAELKNGSATSSAAAAAEPVVDSNAKVVSFSFSKGSGLQIVTEDVVLRADGSVSAPAAAAAAAGGENVWNGIEADLGVDVKKDQKSEAAAGASSSSSSAPQVAGAAVSASAAAAPADEALESKLAEIKREKARLARYKKMYELSTGDNQKLCCALPFERLVRRVQREYEKHIGAEKPVRYTAAFFYEFHEWAQSFLNSLIESAVELVVFKGGKQVMPACIRQAMYKINAPVQYEYRTMTLPALVEAFEGFDPRPMYVLTKTGEAKPVDVKDFVDTKPVAGGRQPRMTAHALEGRYSKILTSRSSLLAESAKNGSEETKYLDGLTNSSLKRLSETGKGLSISHKCYDEIRAVLTTFILAALIKCNHLLDGTSPRRNTMTRDDLCYVSSLVYGSVYSENVRHLLQSAPVAAPKKADASDEGEDEEEEEAEDDESDTSDDEDEEEAAPAGAAAAAASDDS